MKLVSLFIITVLALSISQAALGLGTDDDQDQTEANQRQKELKESETKKKRKAANVLGTKLNPNVNVIRITYMKSGVTGTFTKMAANWEDANLFGETLKRQGAVNVHYYEADRTVDGTVSESGTYVGSDNFSPTWNRTPAEDEAMRTINQFNEGSWWGGTSGI